MQSTAAAGPFRRDHHGGGSHDGPTGLPPNEPLGTSSGHCPQGRSCSDPCGESSQDSTHGGPSRAMRVIQRHRPPGPGRHWPAPPQPRCLPGAPGACRALAGSVNWSKSCAWTPPLFPEFPDLLPPPSPPSAFLKQNGKPERRLRKDYPDSDMIRRRPLAHPHRRAQSTTMKDWSNRVHLSNISTCRCP